MIWWMKKLMNLKDIARWIPEKVPTLIMGGTDDCINPISLFLNDSRFQKSNIRIAVIKDAGHFPWFENKELIKELIEQFIEEHSLLN